MDKSLFKSNIRIKFKFIPPQPFNRIILEDSDLNVIIMNRTETLNITFDDGREEIIEPYTLKLFGPHSRMNIFSESGGGALLMYFDYVGRYCDSKVCEYLDASVPNMSNTSSTLKMDYSIMCYVDLMLSTFDDIPEEEYFTQIKYKEFFYILCKNLSIEEFSSFLHPAMSWYDPVFRRKVLDNYEEDYRAKTLAARCGYSCQEFCEKFRLEFGEPPSSWLRKQMMSIITHNLSNPCIPIKDIADSLKMSSVQQFTRFCKTAFGKTPTQLRAEFKR